MRLKIKFYLVALLLVMSQLLVAAPAGLCQEAADKITVVVLPFEVNTEDPELDYLREGLPDLLGSRLAEAGFSVVPQEETLSIIRDQGVEFLDLATARDLALLGKAGYAVYGSFNQVGDTISIDARLVEAFGLKPAKPLFVVRDGIINVLPAIEDLAQNIQLELMKKDRIAEIDVTGNIILEKEVVLMRLGITEGDIYDPAKINDEVKSVYDLGYFDDVRVNVAELPDGIRVVFEVQEKPRIQTLDVRGNEEIEDDDIMEVMSTKSGSVLNPKVLADDLEKIRQLYRKEGYYKAEVEYSLEQTDPRQARLNIDVEEGDKLYIRDIAIEGAEQIDEGDIKDELSLSERGFLSWITGTGVLVEENLERDVAAIEAFYANRGFMDASVGQPVVEFKEDGIYITFQVSEGERYKVGKVDISGDVLVDKQELFDLIELDELGADNDYLDRSIMRKDAQALTEFYTDYGYAFAETDYSLNVDKENSIVDITFQMHKHQQVYIRRVMISGNTETRDNVIRRELRLSDGDLFSGSKLRRSTERLNKLGYFEEATIEPVRTMNDDELDLLVNVQEKSTGEIAAGFGYSTFAKFYVMGSITEHNLFGKGYSVGLRAFFGGRSTGFGLSFTNPSLYDTPLAVGGDAYIETLEYDDFDKDTVGGRIRFGYPLGEYTRLNWSYRLDRYTIKDVEDDAADDIKDIEGVNWSSAFLVGATRDTTNRRLNPTEGSIYKLSVEYAGGLLMGDDDFIKYLGSASHFYPLPWGFEHVFHFHAEAGLVTRNLTDDEVPVFERFYLGGMNDIRGYGGNDISPRDEESNDKIGGTKKAFTNFEYLFPLNTEFGLIGVLFYDMGDAWTDEFDLKRSVGAGVRWYSPMGPLRLEYGYALDEIPDQGTKGKLEFSVGQMF